MSLLFRTVNGLEKIASQEICEKLNVTELIFSPYGPHGWIRCNTPDNRFGDVRRLRSITEAYLILNEERYSEGFSIDHFADTTVKAIPVYAPHARSISVSAYSSHRRPSQREIQGAFSKRIVEKLNAECNLKTYDTSLKISLLKNVAVASIDLEIQPGNMPKLETHPTPLLPPIAYCMVRLSAPLQGERLLDPMCGCGTIPLMAALEWGDLEVVGSDIEDDYVFCARRNAEKIGLGEKARFLASDFVKLAGEGIEADIIAVNPPFGISLPIRHELEDLYEVLFKKAFEVLSRKGRIAVVTPYPRLVEEKVRNRFSISCAYRFLEGELKRTIQILKKTY